MLAIQLKTHMHAKIMKKNVSRIVLGWLLYSQCDFLSGKQTRKTNEVFQSDDSLLLHFPMYCLCFWGIYKRAKSWFYHRSIAFSGLTVNSLPSELYAWMNSMHGGEVTPSDICVATLIEETSHLFEFKRNLWSKLGYSWSFFFFDVRHVGLVIVAWRK